MDDAPEFRSAELCRRSMIRNLAVGIGGVAMLAAAGGAAMLAATVGGSRVAEAQTKAAQKAVGYQDTPKGAQRCDNCKLFEAPSACKTVEGPIAAAGWCRFYLKIPT